jgi:hypothetical protein
LLGRDPYDRWQSLVAVESMQWALRRGVVSLESSRRIEARMRQLLGQPFSVRQWPRMTFNDKVAFRKLCSREPYLRRFSDKLAMRDYVLSVLGPDALPRLLSVSRSVDELTELRGPLVLKASHGAGMVSVISADRPLSPAELDTAKHWLTVDFGYWSREWGYDNLARAIIAEELLSDPPPPDYKFFVFDGTVRMIQVDSDRFVDHRRSLFDPRWHLMGTSVYAQPPTPPPAPPHLGRMVSMAETLASGFAFVRVDMYDLPDRLLIGEISCYPESGRCRFTPEALDRLLGCFWSLAPEVVAGVPRRGTAASAHTSR